MDKQTEQLQQRTKDFAVRVIKLFRSLCKSPEGYVLGKQLLRSGTSVAANYRAACRATSRPECIARIGVVAEEADESALWIELFAESGVMKKGLLDGLLNEARELTAIFTASRDTAKKR